MHVTKKPRSRRLVIMTVLVVALATLAPAAVIAAGTFTDVPETHLFFNDIEWMAANGITLGCGGGEYCPEDSVTRGQMSAFMRRLATNQVVDAGALEGNAAADFVMQNESLSISAGMLQLDSVGAAQIKDDAVGATEIAAGAVGASEIAASAVGTSEVADGSLTAADLADEAGVAQAADGAGVNIELALTTIETVTIAAPTDGYVIVSGTTQVNMNHVTGTASNIDIAVMRDSATSYASDEDHDIDVPAGAATGVYRFVVGMTKAFAVSAGSNTFKLAADISSGTGHVAADYQLTVFFVPSAYGVVEISGVGVATSGSDE